MENKDKLSIRNWEPNALIYDYNTPSFNAYYIIEGQVDIFTPRGLKLNSIGPSEVFGEASLLLDKKRSVTARAGTSGVKTKLVPKSYITDLQKSSPILSALLRNVQMRLVDSNENVRAGGPNSLKSPTVSERRKLQPAVLSEQQLYQMAYDSVINSNFERSIAEFDQYMSVYPTGRFVTNAHYWKGQAYLYLDRYAEAKDSYEIILNRYEDSAKLADAMYGLGLSYQGLGNITQAKQLLNEIKRRFPNTGVANLADTKLLQLD